MKALIPITACILLSTTLHAQVDLTKDPNKPSVTKEKSNAQLLRESRTPASPINDTASLNRKFNTTGNVNGTTNNGYINGNPQPMNAQQQQYDLGGTKATNSIYYDNAGKVQGSGTSIEFKKKKK